MTHLSTLNERSSKRDGGNRKQSVIIIPPRPVHDVRQFGCRHDSGRSAEATGWTAVTANFFTEKLVQYYNGAQAANTHE